MSLVRKAAQTLKQECGFKEGSSILVACSAGPDSVALLYFLYFERQRLGIGKLGLYHLNHGLRGEEADQDEAFVRELAGQLDLSFHSEKADVALYASEHGLSLEMAGRKLRYEGLERVMRSEGYDYAALGHTASDNAEWLLLSLLRGRAEPALWGIPARRQAFIRPFIRVSREDVMEYLSRHRLDFRIDSSNLELSFDRNRIRHKVMPLLKELNPSFEETLSRVLKLGDMLKDSIEREANEVFATLLLKKGKRRELDTSRLSSYNLGIQFRVLRLFAPWLGASEILRLMPLKIMAGTVELARGCGERVLGCYDRLVCEPTEPLGRWEPLSLTEEVYLAGLGWRIALRKGYPEELMRDEDSVYFDARLVKPPFTVRPWCEGDRIVPLGHRRPSKVKRVFIERKVPLYLRRTWPIVCKGEEVLWVAGLVRSAAAPVTVKTREVTVLTLLRGKDDG